MRNTLFFDAGVFFDVEYELLIATWKVTLHWRNRQKSEKRRENNANAPKSSGQSTFDAGVYIRPEKNLTHYIEVINFLVA